MTRLFTDTLKDINAGKFVEELTEQLAEAVGHATATGKSASLTVVLKIKPAKGGGNVLTIEHDSKLKVPEFDRPPTYLFLGPDNALLTSDPRQQSLPLRAVPSDKPAPLREDFDRSTGEIRSPAAA